MVTPAKSLPFSQTVPLKYERPQPIEIQERIRYLEDPIRHICKAAQMEWYPYSAGLSSLPHLIEQIRLIRDFGDLLSNIDQSLRSYSYRLHYETFKQQRDELQHCLPWATSAPGAVKSTSLHQFIEWLKENNLRGFIYSLIIPRAGEYARTDSSFSSAPRQYFVEGDVNGTPVEALPDTGADMCFISPKLACDLGLSPDAWTPKEIQLANKKCVESPGMVEVAWRFTREQKPHILNCWILPGCVHDIVLGNHFLNATQTLTKFKNRIKSKLVDLPRRLRLRLLGEEKQRLWGYLDGHLTAALPDTGSDVMLISSIYARRIGLLINRDFEQLLEVEFADGTTAWTSGVIRDVPWEVGGATVRCDFHVLDALCVDVVLSKDYLFDLNVFSENSEYFFNVDSEDDLFQLFNIRLIGRYGDTLNILEEEYLQDGKRRVPEPRPLADDRYSGFPRRLWSRIGAKRASKTRPDPR